MIQMSTWQIILVQHNRSLFIVTVAIMLQILC